MSNIRLYGRRRNGLYLCKCQLKDCCNFFTKTSRKNKQMHCQTHKPLLKSRINKKWNRVNMQNYYSNNKSKWKKSHNRWRKNNLDRWNKICKNWRIANPDKFKEYQRKSKRKHPERSFEYFKRISDKLGIVTEEYRRAVYYWARVVKKRDGFSCVICGSDKKLNAHHIFLKSYYPELSLNTNNGVTLCLSHHHEVHGHNL